MPEQAPPLRRLRELPGVSDIEASLGLKNALWAPENDDLDDRIDKLCLRAFGVTPDGTEVDPPGDEAPDTEWDTYDSAWEEREDHFRLLDECTWEDARPVWEILGWDVTDGRDQPLKALQRIGRPLIAAIKGIAGGVLPDEDGRAPRAKLSDAALAEEAKDWESRVREEAEAFRARKRRG